MRFDLLHPAEQTLFARLAVFSGGCTLAAAEAVCHAAGERPVDVLDGLASLVDKSLLRPEEAPGGDAARFGMLEGAGERRHAVGFVAFHRVGRPDHRLPVRKGQADLLGISGRQGIEKIGRKRGITGHGGFISQPLAIVVIGGLVSSTFLTLIYVPVFYDLFESARRRLGVGAAFRGREADSGTVPEARETA